MSDQAGEIARWMLAEVKKEGTLPQDYAAAEIENRFGTKYIVDRDDGGISIAADVLAAFRAVSASSVVWERGTRMWRLREPGDPPGRQAD